MKKIGIFSALLCLSLGCVSSSDENSDISLIEKHTYKIESIKSSKTDMSDYKWISGNVADFEKISLKQSLSFFENNLTGVIYYGYPGCPWCERAIVELNDVAYENEDTIYYVDAYESVNGSDINQLKEYLDDILEIDADTGEKEILVPLIIGVSEGKLVGSHVALVDGFSIKNDSSQMNDKQKKELQEIYKNIISKCIS